MAGLQTDKDAAGVVWVHHFVSQPWNSSQQESVLREPGMWINVCSNVSWRQHHLRDTSTENETGFVPLVLWTLEPRQRFCIYIKLTRLQGGKCPHSDMKMNDEYSSKTNKLLNCDYRSEIPQRRPCSSFYHSPSGPAVKYEEDSSCAYQHAVRLGPQGRKRNSPVYSLKVRIKLLKVFRLTGCAACCSVLYSFTISSSQWAELWSILRYVRLSGKFSLMSVFILCTHLAQAQKPSPASPSQKIVNINIFTIAQLRCSTNKTRGFSAGNDGFWKSYSPYSNCSSAREIMMLNGPQTKDWTHSFRVLVLLFRWNIAPRQ